MCLLENNEIVIGNWIEDKLDGLSILIKDGEEQLFISSKKREKKKIILTKENKKITDTDAYKKIKMFYNNIKNRII